MPAFIVATVTITDAEAFRRYASAIEGLAERYGGQYLVRGPVIEYLENEGAAGERVVVLRFDDADAARQFYRCEQYQSAKKHRERAANLTMRLIEA